MTVYVTLKQVPDTETKIVLKDEQTIDDSGIKWIMNPYDEFAVEEAIRLKEGGKADEVVVVCIGPVRAQEAIRTALAMGADRALHVEMDTTPDHIAVAKALGKVMKADGDPQLVFMGKQAIDDDGFQVHLRLAHYLGAAVSTNVNSFEFANDKAIVSREVGGGEQEKLELALPAVIAVDKAINKPRYPTLPNIMKAKRKEIKVIPASDIGLTDSQITEQILKYEMPPAKQGGKVLQGEHTETVPELARLLKDEAKVL